MFVFSALFCILHGCIAPAAHDSTTAFVDVSVIPMDRDRVMVHQTVIVSNGRIAALGPSATTLIPRGARRIDGRGKFLLPGLADMHVHLGYINDSTDAIRSLVVLAASGVTTVRNMDNRPFGAEYTRGFVLGLRARTASGALIGPRIYTSGPWNPDDHATGGSPVIDTMVPHYVLDRIRRYKADGYDFVKVHDENPAAYRQVVAAAKQVGIPVEGHVTPGLTLQEALANHQVSIEHLLGYPVGPPFSDSIETDPAKIAALVAATKAAGTWNCPTLAVWGDDSMMTAPRYRFVKALQDGGAGLLSGTDWGLFPDSSFAGYVKDQAVVLTELQDFVWAGLTPYQALATSTRNPAQLFGTFKETGTVTVGKRADLVLLDANPLENIANVRRVAGVVLDGRWFTHAALMQHVNAAQQTDVGGARYGAVD